MQHLAPAIYVFIQSEFLKAVITQYRMSELVECPPIEYQYPWIAKLSEITRFVVIDGME